MVTIRIIRKIVVLSLCFLLAGEPLAQTASAEAVTPVSAGVTASTNDMTYRTLQRDMEGADVIRLKQRMQELGFFIATAVLTDRYNSTMEYKVKQYQNALGVKATGIASPELQKLIYSENGGLPTATPVAMPTPAPSDRIASTSLPEPTHESSTKTSAQTTLKPLPTATPSDMASIGNGTGYRVLKADMSGEDVLRLKQRLQELGFFSATAELTDSYNSTMEYKVKQYQNTLGLTATGVATPELQTTIYTENGGLPLTTPVPTPETVMINGVAYRTLKQNMTGEDVQRLRERLQQLGYYPQNMETSDLYNSTMEYKVKQYQSDLGIKATGIATPELQATAFTDYGGLPTPIPLALPSLPPLTKDGFLLAQGQEYVYENNEMGQWIYLSTSLRIEITRYTREGNNPLIWYETSIQFTDAQAFQRLNAKEKYKNHFNTEYPDLIAVRNNLVLAFSDDFYGIRKHRRQKQGVIICDGQVVANDPYKKNIVTYMPPLDIMAFFKDGSAKAFYGNEYTAEELLGMGVQNTLCFGPVLLRDGQLGQQVADGKFASNEPRCALGMIAPRHYLLITVEGRYSGSKGTGLNWIATRMQQLGVQDAVNLDGGNTTALVFRGKLLNKIGTFDGELTVIRGVRSVSSIMGIGQNLTPIPAENTK